MKTIYKKIIVLIDAYSTGRYLLSAFNGHGYQCIHIIPSSKLNQSYLDRYEQDKHRFLKTLLYDGDLAALLAQLSEFDIMFIIAGSEAGVCLADELNDKLKLPLANNMQYSRARRDKYLMQLALQDYGLRIIPNLLTDNLQDLLQWQKQLNSPLVLKPIASSDAEGVYFCYTQTDIRNAFHNIIDSTSHYGEKNTVVLAQKKMEGKEYVVNSVSYAGRHVITDVWTNTKMVIDKNSLYDYQRQVGDEETTHDALVGFAQQVLDALHIRFGAAHSEIIVSHNQIYLIEVGARLSGGFNPSFSMENHGYSQVSALVDAYLRPDFFINQINFPNKSTQKAMIVSLIATCSGKIVSEFNATPFKDLPSFFCMQHNFNLGADLLKTTDLTTSPGNIYLLADNDTALLRDYQRIRILENNIYKQMVGSL